MAIPFPQRSPLESCVLGYRFRPNCGDAVAATACCRRCVFVSASITKCAISCMTGRRTSIWYSARRTGNLISVTSPISLEEYDIRLPDRERTQLRRITASRASTRRFAVMALKAKACMTAHQRALPRLYDELNSSHLIVHGAPTKLSPLGFAMVNAGRKILLSPDLNKKNRSPIPNGAHTQPRDAQLAIDKIKQLPRRSKAGDFLATMQLAITIIDMANDGATVQDGFRSHQRLSRAKFIITMQ